MTKYKSKPKIIEAVRIRLIDGDEVVFDVGEKPCPWLTEAINKPVGEEGGIWVLNKGVRVGTLEGTMRADAGDYIVRGVFGEIYSVKPEVFEASYEAISP